MTYTCSRCGTKAEEKITTQGGVRQHHIPERWAELTIRTGETAREEHYVLCGWCLPVVRSSLSGMSVSHG